MGLNLGPNKSCKIKFCFNLDYLKVVEFVPCRFKVIIFPQGLEWVLFLNMKDSGDVDGLEYIAGKAPSDPLLWNYWSVMVCYAVFYGPILGTHPCLVFLQFDNIINFSSEATQ